MSIAAPLPPSRGRRFALAANIVAACVYALSLPVWYFVSLFSVMLFDDPNADRFPPALILYYSLQAYPYVTVVTIAASWLSFRKRRYRSAVLLNVAPAALVAIGFLPMLIWGE